VRMFNKVLVANRGEIAVRVMRTLNEMGIASVAVYSEADEGALHVLSADEAVALGDPTPSESYLNIDKIIDAAKQTGAEAIHPGYGFLSENAAFARRVAEAGLTFIGPSAEVIEALGDKIEARRLALQGGAPITPGTDEPESDPEKLSAAAEQVGYPVLIKAAGGGGGKGMRVVHEPAELADAARQASSEAQAAFGNPTIFLEKFIERPRHVEIQILADTHGNVVHLFERECSIQRRYQKIIEETPSPALDDALRQRMGEAAVAVATAAGYTNAGTVEFLLDADGSFYFMEVNARLQVEHPVTEMITGLDLVRCQLEIAAGEELGFTQQDLARRGHAIECRIYAEDPAQGFLPAPGTVLLAHVPEGPGLRYDRGVVSGSEVPVHYDPILGKLVAHAPTRAAAIERMIRALEECVVLGVHTPVEFLIEVLRSEAFRKGETHTGFIDEHFADWAPGDEGDAAAAIGYALDQMSGSGATATSGAGAVPDVERFNPWQRLGSWDLER